jgi:hypothetical protein
MRSDGRRTQILTLLMVVLALIASSALPQARVYGRDDGGAGDLPLAGASALADGLRPDGTLDPTARGAFDPQGMTLLTTAGGAPVFQPATSAITGTWDPRFADALPSSGVIRVIFVAPNGDLYVGGRFGRIAGITATSLARWDGTAWSALGTDRSTAGSPTVHAVAVDGADVYVGGQFQSFGGVAADSLARWDGQAWHAVGSGFEPDPEKDSGVGVGSLAMFQGDLLIAGKFTSFSGVASRNIVRWDGTAAFAIETDFEYFSMVTTSHGVYMKAVRPGYAQDVLVWDGTTLAPLAAAPISVFALQAFADDLYLFGRLQAQSGDTSLKLARWDGSSLIPVATDLPADANSFAIGAQGLYVSTGTALYRWTGSAWQEDGACYCNLLALAGDGLYWFDYSAGLVHQDGTQQTPIELLETAPAVVAARDGNVYVGTSPVVGTHGSSPTDHFFRWKDGIWTNIWPYADDYFNFAYPTITADGTLYVQAGTANEYPQIYRYRNNTWQALPDQPNILKSSMVLSGTDLLMFDPDYYGHGDIFRWNGTGWSTIPGPAGADEHAHRLFVLQGRIYMTLMEYRIWEPARVFLRRWTGSAWIDVGPELSGYIMSVAVSDDAAYIGGIFQNADGSIRNIARWDGTTLQGMGAPDGFVSIVAASGTTVYAGGSFGQIDGCACTNLGRWNGNAWEPLGSGTNGTVRDIAVDGHDVYVQGEFSLAGDLPAMGMSVWHEQRAQEPPPTITPTATATATQATPTGSPAPSATATATATQPLVAAERAIFLPLVLR